MSSTDPGDLSASITPAPTIPQVAIEPHEGSRLVAVLQSGARIVASRPGTAPLKARIS